MSDLFTEDLVNMMAAFSAMVIRYMSWINLWNILFTETYFAYLGKMIHFEG